MIPQKDLKNITGDTTFSKGRALFNAGKVQVQTQTTNNIIGVVSGTYNYNVSIEQNNNHYIFDCTCPAIEYQGVCKHCVALVHAHELFEKNKTTKTKDTIKNNTLAQEDILLQYIKTLPTDTLHTTLYKLICNDNQTAKIWLNKAQLASQTHSIKSLKKMVTKALPMKDVWEYYKVAVYFKHALQALDDIFGVSSCLQPEDQLKLALHIYKRLDKVLERVDDSGGYRFGLQDKLAEFVINVIEKHNWSPEEKAHWLSQALAFNYEGFPEIPYQFNLSDNEINIFLDTCQEIFDSIEVNTNSKNREINYQLNQLGDILLSELTEKSDYEKALKIKAKMVTRLDDALTLCQFCLDNNDELEAEDWLLKAKKLIDDSYDKRHWESQAINVYSAIGDTQKAWQLAWALFEKEPRFLAWDRLKKHADTIGWQPENLQNDVEAALLRAETELNIRHYMIGEIVYFYLAEQKHEKAVAWLDTNKANPNILQDAAKALASTYPEKAMMYCKRALSQILLMANNKNYEHAIMLLQELHAQLPNKENAHRAFNNLIETLAQENHKRPNMMKLLHAAFIDTSTFNQK